MEQNQYLSKHLYAPLQIMEEVGPDLEIIVVIPCFNEPEIITTLNSLKECKLPGGSIEIILLLNSGEFDDDLIINNNLSAFWQVEEWKSKNIHSPEKFNLHILNYQRLPNKIAGVGLARKLAMDEAVKRFDDAGNPNGIIVNLDADCEVDSNYFTAIEDHFRQNPKTNACSIYFEHPLQGSLPKENYNSIKKYELYLRYYIEGLRHSKYIHAWHTVGSSMAVRSIAYQQQGGMNKRKAAEDFYFLHKFMLAGNFSEINTTTVRPSARLSDRVPFGTGKAISKLLESDDKIYYANHPDCFKDLENFLGMINELSQSVGLNEYHRFISKLPRGAVAFLTEEGFYPKLKELQHQSTNFQNFEKRFYYWFNGLKTLQFIHYTAHHIHGKIPVEEAASILLDRVLSISNTNYNPGFLLEKYRIIQKSGGKDAFLLTKAV